MLSLLSDTSAALRIVITASHNPKEYNGYKVYNQHGYQAVPKEADQIITYVHQVKDLASIPVMDEAAAREQGLLVSVDSSVLDAYLEAVHAQSVLSNSRAKADLRGSLYSAPWDWFCSSQAVLSGGGFENLFVVEEQQIPDGHFPLLTPQILRNRML